MNLFELTGQYLALMEMMEDPETDPQTLEDTMAAIEGELEDKADAYAAIRTQLLGQSEIIDAEIERLKRRKGSIEGNIKRLTANLEASMRATGKVKFKTATHSFGIQKNGGLAPLILDRTDYEKFPEEFRKVKYEPDNQKIREYLKYHTLEWARLGEQGESLRIR